MNPDHYNYKKLLKKVKVLHVKIEELDLLYHFLDQHGFSVSSTQKIWSTISAVDDLVYCDISRKAILFQRDVKTKNITNFSMLYELKHEYRGHKLKNFGI